MLGLVLSNKVSVGGMDTTISIVCSQVKLGTILLEDIYPLFPIFFARGSGMGCMSPQFRTELFERGSHGCLDPDGCCTNGFLFWFCLKIVSFLAD